MYSQQIMQNNADLRERNYIFCPLCGHNIYPVINGGTDGQMTKGSWACDNCNAQFALEIEMMNGKWVKEEGEVK